MLRTRGERPRAVTPIDTAAVDRGGASGWVLPFIVVAMDTAWITPYAILLGTIWLTGARSLVAPIAMFALLACGQIAGRAGVSGLSGPRSARVRFLLVVAGVAAATLVVAWQYRGDGVWRMHGPLWRWAAPIVNGDRPELPAWVLALLVWRRGLVIGRTTLEYYDVETIFTLGLGAFGVFAAAMAAGHSVALLAATAVAAFPYLLGFFLTSLVALPIARLQSVQRQTRASQRNTTVSGDWYALVVGAALILLGTAVIAGAVLRLDVGAVFRALGPAVDLVLVVLLYMIAYPIGLVLAGIVWAIRQVLHPRAVQQLSAPSPATWLQQLTHGNANGLSPEATAALWWSLALMMLLIVLVWIARSVFWYERAGRRLPADIVRESVWSWADLRASWRDLFQRRPPEGGAGMPGFGSGMTGAIRRTYAEFLGMGDALGVLRQESQTPAEFARAVSKSRPIAAASADVLTDIYSRVRYGLEAPSPDDVEAARAALARVRVETLLDTDNGRESHSHGVGVRRLRS